MSCYSGHSSLADRDEIEECLLGCLTAGRNTQEIDTGLGYQGVYRVPGDVHLEIYVHAGLACRTIEVLRDNSLPQLKGLG